MFSRIWYPFNDDETIAKDTNIDRFILFDLLKVERTNRANGILNQTEDVLKKYRTDEMTSIEDFDEEEPYSEIDNGEYDDLIDLSEHEDMINWDEISDGDDMTEHEKQLYNRTRDIDVNEN